MYYAAEERFHEVALASDVRRAQPPEARWSEPISLAPSDRTTRSYRHFGARCRGAEGAAVSVIVPVLGYCRPGRLKAGRTDAGA